MTRDWKGRTAPRSCRRRLYELRQPPLALYEGKWTGFTTWEPLPSSYSCEPPQANLGGLPVNLSMSAS